MDWPSDRIPQGGAFHTPRVNYSKETHDMIKLLMQESNLTMLQRNKINYHLRNGDFLPNPKMQSRVIPAELNEMKRAEQIINKSRVARKRTLETIEQSGVFKCEKFVPKIDYHVSEAKQRLQEKMSGCKVFPELERVQLKNKDKHRINKISDEPDDRIAELLSEIYERIDWIREMQELGEATRHQGNIHAEITERLREIHVIEQKIEKQKSKRVQDKDGTMSF